MVWRSRGTAGWYLRRMPKSLNGAITAEQAAPDAPQAEEDLLTAAVNRTILEGFSALYEQIAAEYGVTPVTDPDFELLQ